MTVRGLAAAIARGLEAASFLSVSGHCVLIDGAVRLAQGSSQ